MQGMNEFLYFITYLKIISEFLLNVCLLADGYPSLFKCWLGDKLFICVYDPNEVEVKE